MQYTYTCLRIYKSGSDQWRDPCVASVRLVLVVGRRQEGGVGKAIVMAAVVIMLASKNTNLHDVVFSFSPSPKHMLLNLANESSRNLT